MESRFWSNSAGRPSASTAILYSLIWSADAFEILLADVRQHQRQVGRPMKNSGRQDGLELMFFLARIRQQHAWLRPEANLKAVYTRSESAIQVCFRFGGSVHLGFELSF